MQKDGPPASATFVLERCTLTGVRSHVLGKSWEIEKTAAVPGSQRFARIAQTVELLVAAYSARVTEGGALPPISVAANATTAECNAAASRWRGLFALTGNEYTRVPVLLDVLGQAVESVAVLAKAPVGSEPAAEEVDEEDDLEDEGCSEDDDDYGDDSEDDSENDLFGQPNHAKSSRVASAALRSGVIVAFVEEIFKSHTKSKPGQFGVRIVCRPAGERLSHKNGVPPAPIGDLRFRNEVRLGNTKFDSLFFYSSAKRAILDPEWK